MKFKALGLVLVGGLFVVGCKVSVVDGAGGSGSTTTTGSKMTTTTGSKMATTTTGASMSTGMQVDCSTLPCTDSDMDPSNDCLGCSQTMGLCVDQTQTCNDNAECGAFLDCINLCPDDDPSTANDENLECLCTPNAAGDACDQMNQPPGTCVGDHMGGISDYIALADCVLGDGMGTDGECTAACPQN